MATRTDWQKIVTSTLGIPAKLCNVKLLINGHATFANMVEAIKTAKSSSDSIYILGWTLEVDFALIPGDPNTTLLALLKEAVRKGVYVKILIWADPQDFDLLKLKRKLDDAFSVARPQSGIPRYEVIIDGHSPIPKRDIVTFLKPYAEKILTFSAIASPWPDLRSKCLKIYSMLKRITSVASHHEKVMIVTNKDGSIGFCGGIDINDNRLGDFYDVHCRVEQHGAQELLYQFARREFNFRYPNQTVVPPKAPIITSQNFNSTLDYAYTKIVHTYNYNRTVENDRSMLKIIEAIIQNAKTYIYMEDQYLVSTKVADLLNKKLKEQNFKRLIILTQDAKITDELLFPNDKRRIFLQHLLNNLAVKDKEKVWVFMTHTDYKRTYPSTDSRSKLPPPASYVHSKLYLVDDELVLISSANCSSRSLTLDSETGAVIFEANNNLIVQNFRKNLWGDRTKDYTTRSQKFSQDPDPIKASECFRAEVRLEHQIIGSYQDSGDDLDVAIMNAVISEKPPGWLQALSYDQRKILELSFTSTKVAAIGFLKGILPPIKNIIWPGIVDPDNDA